MTSVLHIYKDYYPPVIGGIEKHIHQVATGTRNDYEVRVLVANTRAKTEMENIDGVEVIKAGSLGRFASAPLCPGFPALLKKYSADILHFHCPNPTGEISYLLARPRGKVIVTYHSDVIRQKFSMILYGRYLKKFLDCAKAILPTSPDYIDASPYLSRVRQRCTVIPLGIETARFRDTPDILARAAEIRKISKGRPLIIFVGRLRYYKGLEFLIQAMPRIEADLLIVGTGPEEDNIKNQSRLFKASERVHLIGNVSDDDLPAYYYAADVFCLPSHLRSEAYGLVQLEAMACGLPVVSCRIKTGVPFVNRDGETGLIVSPASPGKLAEAINALLKDEELRLRLGRQAKKRALEEFDLSLMLSRIRNVYDKVLSEG
jgi:glycosyltransferase involved in cell wall biosynthesis